ncbi:hypothetical protein DFS34DRAFT_652947 [Phlyctochytrium arcticum]|nr:hypothetical protein DFS34DRAFT_652947 [Phlyctochytrium arcticum]
MLPRKLVLITRNTAVLEPTRKLELVIGTDNYMRYKPTGAANDANAMGDLLEGYGFEVYRAINAPYRKVASLAAEFGTLRRRDDLAVVFFAGHGAELNQENYLCLRADEPAEGGRWMKPKVRDAENTVGGEWSMMRRRWTMEPLTKLDVLQQTKFVDEDEPVDGEEAYRLSTLLDVVTDVFSPRKYGLSTIAIIDACRTDAEGRTVALDQQPVTFHNQYLVAFASDPGRDVNESGEHGAWTKAFLQQVKETPDDDIVSLLTRTRNRLFFQTRMDNSSEEPRQPQCSWTHECLHSKITLR